MKKTAENGEKVSRKGGKKRKMTALRFENVCFSYQTNEWESFGEFSSSSSFSLKNVNFSVEEGEFVAVLGHNGSGKSTLARLCNGLLTPVSGAVHVFDESTSNEKKLFQVRRQVGVVFQNPDNQTVASIVEDDVAFGPENVGIPREEIGERIEFALRAVGMEKFRQATPARLSGGQKQRIAIAGVLALKPKIMILDESTAMLDPRGRKEVMDVVLRLNREEKITVLLITHFPEEALLADRAIVMNGGEIVAQGKPVDVLCNEQELEQYHLTLPLPVRMCRMLTRGGLPVNDCYEPEKIAGEILKYQQVGNVADVSAQVEPSGEEDCSGEIVCENLTHIYNPASPFSTKALCGVDVHIFSGDFFGVIGHTGSGKSTFVQHLNALLKVPTAEKKYKPKKKSPPPFVKLTVAGYDLTDKKTDFRALRSKVGMVFQYPEYQLFAETVFDDVAFGLKNFSASSLSRQEIETAVRDALETVGLSYEEVKDKSPFELSGGQKRRVAIAGVIVAKPQILVLDEPAAGLDPLGKEEIMRLLHDIHGKWCKTVIIVSHDMDEIAENCTRAAVFADGKVVAVDTPKNLFDDIARLETLGLDVPYTAKVATTLRKNGVKIPYDYTVRDFVEKTLACFCGAKGGEV